MDDSLLLGIAFFVSTAGLVALFFVSGQLQPTPMDISEIDLSHQGKRVATAGEITSLRFHQDGHIFLEISDGSKDLQAVIFEGAADGLSPACLKEGKMVEVVGRVEGYRGKPEIIIARGEDLRCST
jgi:DNA/RNA endonuclease YhcR with UshA esterase domain